jgi:hypothetical protein
MEKALLTEWETSMTPFPRGKNGRRIGAVGKRQNGEGETGSSHQGGVRVNYWRHPDGRNFPSEKKFLELSLYEGVIEPD